MSISDIRAALVTAVSVFLACLAPVEAAAESNLHFEDLVWGVDLSVAGEHRTRYESIVNGGNAIFLRTNVLVEAGIGNFKIGGELMDSRAYNPTGSLPFSFRRQDQFINTIEPIQYYLTADFENVFTDGLDVSLKGGRFTLDLGSGRHFGRNQFRNTVENFRGGQVALKHKEQALLLFFANPMRVETDRTIGQQMDFPITRIDLLGAHYTNNAIATNINAEAYLYYLKANFREAGAARLTYFTSGFRVWKERRTGAIDFEIEATPQFRQHPQGFSYYGHAEAGFEFDETWRPHLSILFDIASGDGEAALRDCYEFEVVFSGPNCPQRVTTRGTTIFTPLFGRLSDDFGPTGLYQSNATGFDVFSSGNSTRSNIISPAVRLSANPDENLFAQVTFRGFWREDPRFRVTPSTADLIPNYYEFEYFSSNFGYQIDAKATLNLFDDVIQLEAGGVVFFDGKESDELRESCQFCVQPLDSSKYFYTSLTAEF